MNSTALFRRQKKVGVTGETLVARWLVKRGWSVLPAYGVPVEAAKGPRLYTPSGDIIAPDILAIRKNEFLDTEVCWFEVKKKAYFSWYRAKTRWVAGIDLRNYEEYLRIIDILPLPLWLVFVHLTAQPRPEDIADGCPSECPTGIFGERLDVLRRCESHRSDKSNMVYWAHASLRRFAKVNDDY